MGPEGTADSRAGLRLFKSRAPTPSERVRPDLSTQARSDRFSLESGVLPGPGWCKLCDLSRPRMSTDLTPLPQLPDRLETVRMDALSEAARGGGRGALEMHRAIANRLMKEGAPARAFTELVRATREVPMSAKLAAALAHIALKAGTLSAAVTLLTQGVEEVEGAERAGVRHALARLYRRSEQLEPAREQLVVLLAEAPADRRARSTLNALLEREERWEELDASLEKETREELRRGTLRRASRSALKRARLWGERLGNFNRAALRYGQAAGFAEQGQDFESAFLLRLLWLRSLQKSQAPERVLNEAIETATRAGERVGKADRVRHMVQELRLNSGAVTEVAVEIVSEGARHTGEEPVPARRNSTQDELMAVAAEAERQGRKSEGAALLHAAVDEGPDPQALKRLEANCIARGAWRELAQFYRDTAAKALAPLEKAQWKEKLAELLESELSDPGQAARTWGEVVALTGDQRAVKEQVRLHAARKDVSGVRRALDEGVARATAGLGKADALVARAEEALTRKDFEVASADFRAALGALPEHPPALAGLAELGVARGDSHFVPLLKAALDKMPRRRPGRGELLRRLARLAQSGVTDAKTAVAAWKEVLLELPRDEEAQSQLAVLAREGGDAANLETMLRTQIAQEPRGTRARLARLELVSLLERSGRLDEGLEELRQSVRFEPGHQEAWFALADRLEHRGIWAEAAWALEHAATATSDGALRIRLWVRLARFVRDRLNDEAKAVVYENRAEKLRRELQEDAAALPVGPLAGPLTVPPPRAAGALTSEKTPPDTDFEAFAHLLEAVIEPDPIPVPAPTPKGRGGIPREAIEILRTLAAGLRPGPAASKEEPKVTAAVPSPVRPPTEGAMEWDDVTGPSEAANPPQGNGRGGPTHSRRSAPNKNALRPEVKSEGRGLAVPKSVELRPEVKSEGRGLAVPKSVELRPEVKSDGRGLAVPKSVELRPEMKSEGRGLAVPKSVELRPEVKSEGRGLAVPKSVELRPEVKSEGRGLAVPRSVELRPEVKSEGRGLAVPKSVELRPEVKSEGRGLAVPKSVELRPEVKSEGRGLAVPKSAEPSSRPDLKSSPGGRIPAVEARQTPAIALKPRASAPDAAPPATSGPTAVLQETRNLRVPQVRVLDEEEWEGSTVGLGEEDVGSLEEAMSGIDDLVELGTSDVEVPPGELEPVPPDEPDDAKPSITQELPAPELGDATTDLPPSFTLSPAKLLSKERELLFERVRGAPLDSDAYKLLAEHFDSAGDASRSSLMLEIALALEGDPHAAPRAPKLILSAADRGGLKHPVLRGEEGELLGLCGLALCRIYPTRGSEAGTREEFRLDLGKGAKASADALLTAVRILGLRAPDVYPSNDNGPPFALVFPGAPRLLVGRLAIKRELPEAELRFFAGRALFTQNPDLLALRNLRREQLMRALTVVGGVLKGQTMSAESRAVRGGLPVKGMDRLKQLYERVGGNLNLGVLSEGARHSANRAGLVVCGGVAPALAALRAKKALASEMIELVRFAASDRYLQLRLRKLGK
jgi:tetratricopeptide (TPR) repeat protein